MSETAAAPAAPVATAAPAGPAAAQPAASQGQQTINVHIPPDLLRMAGMQGAQQTPAVEPAKPAETPAAKPVDTKAAETPAKADDATAALTQRLADLEAKHRATLIRAEVDRVAAVAGAIDPAMVHSLIANDLDVTDDGKVIVKGDARTTGEQHIARYLAGKSFLLKPLVPGGGAGTPSTVQAPSAGPTLSMSTEAGATALAQKFATQRGFRPS